MFKEIITVKVTFSLIPLNAPPVSIEKKLLPSFLPLPGAVLKVLVCAVGDKITNTLSASAHCHPAGSRHKNIKGWHILPHFPHHQCIMSNRALVFQYFTNKQSQENKRRKFGLRQMVIRVLMELENTTEEKGLKQCWPCLGRQHRKGET